MRAKRINRYHKRRKMDEIFSRREENNSTQLVPTERNI